jgi:hypothetical protein
MLLDALLSLGMKDSSDLLFRGRAPLTKWIRPILRAPTFEKYIDYQLFGVKK